MSPLVPMKDDNMYPEPKADSWRLGTLFDYTYLLLRYPPPLLGVTAWRGILRICIGVARIVYHGAGYAGGGSSPPVRIWLAATVKGCSAVPRLRTISRGRAVWQARRVHTPKVAGSNPAFAIYQKSPLLGRLLSS